MSNQRLVNFNGELIPETEAKISIYDSALMFGDMVFEMTRSFNKVQFKLDEHIKRLYTGLKIFQIPIQMTPSEMKEACYKTIEANDHLFADNDEHRLMIDVSRGILGIYEDVTGLQKGPNIIVADFPLRWTVKGMGEHIDCDVSKILSREMNLSEAGDELIKTTLRVANGRLTCAEALGHREFVMTKLYRSA